MVFLAWRHTPNTSIEITHQINWLMLVIFSSRIQANSSNILTINKIPTALFPGRGNWCLWPRFLTKPSNLGAECAGGFIESDIR